MATEEDKTNVVDLSWWQHALPVTRSAKELAKKASTAFANSGDETIPWLEYDFVENTAGPGPVRASLAKFLSRQYGADVSRDSLLLCYGATHGLNLLLSSVLKGNIPLFCQQPGFSTAFNQCKETRNVIIAVDSDEHGMSPEDFAEKLERHFGNTKTRSAEQLDIRDRWIESGTVPEKNVEIYSGAAYMIPNFCNPTGTCLSKERHQKVIALARKYNILLICDDVYNMISYVTDSSGDFSPIHPRLFQHDDQNDPDYGIGHVVSIGTFSKIFFPAIRLGWLEVPIFLHQYLCETGFMFGSGGIAAFVSNLICGMLDDKSLDGHLLDLRRFYKEQCIIFDNALKKYLPQEAVYYSPKGGFSFWIELPHHIKAKELLQLSKTNHGIIFLLGEGFSAVPGQYTNCLRLCVANCPNEKLDWVAKCISTEISHLIASKEETVTNGHNINSGTTLTNGKQSHTETIEGRALSSATC